MKSLWCHHHWTSTPSPRSWNTSNTTETVRRTCRWTGLTWCERGDGLTLSRQQRHARRRVLQERRRRHRVEVGLQGELLQSPPLLHLQAGSIRCQSTINTLSIHFDTLWHHQSVTIIKKEPGNCWGRSRNGCRWQHRWRVSWRAHGWPLTWCPPCWKSPPISQHALGQRQTGDLYCEITEFDEWY